jgi:hypothetical protein
VVLAPEVGIGTAHEGRAPDLAQAGARGSKGFEDSLDGLESREELGEGVDATAGRFETIRPEGATQAQDPERSA